MKTVSQNTPTIYSATTPENNPPQLVASLVAYFHERRSLNNFHRDRVITFEQIAE